MMEDSVYVFDARLVEYEDVGCKVAVRASQTLEHLHRALRRAFNWYDDHLYSFWLSGVHWDGPETEFTAPYELAESDARSAGRAPRRSRPPARPPHRVPVRLRRPVARPARAARARATRPRSALSQGAGATRAAAAPVHVRRRGLASVLPE